jgi:hypothetical protein
LKVDDWELALPDRIQPRFACLPLPISIGQGGRSRMLAVTRSAGREANPDRFAEHS